MSVEQFQHRVLVVDDDACLREILTAYLEDAGYEVCTADDGFEALIALRGALPGLIVCDLRMPNMSGFEFLSIVRRRFPQIGIVTISGEFGSGRLPSGTLTDAFLSKPFAQLDLVEALKKITEKSPIRPQNAKPDSAPVWIPRPEKGYLILTCTDCLRSFSAQGDVQKGGSEKETKCIHCGTKFNYIVDRWAVVRQPNS